jgi:hypothetical protein
VEDGLYPTIFGSAFLGIVAGYRIADAKTYRVKSIPGNPVIVDHLVYNGLGTASL